MSTVGTIPDNEDKRPPDIIADRQINRAATDPGTFAETPRPPLPPLPITAPPNIEDVVRDVATTTFRDLAKTMTINGQSPEVSGAGISFEIPTQPAASVQFATLNPPPAPPPVVPVAQPPQAGSITTLQEMEASSAARNAPKTSRQRNEEDMDEMVARRIKADPDYTPSKLASNEEKEAFERAKNPTANPSGFSPTALTPQLQQQLVASVTVGAAGVNFLEVTGEDFDSDRNKPKFGLEKNRLKGETKFEQEDREEEEYRQQKKEYRDKVRALEEEQPGKRAGEGDKKYTEKTNEARLDTMNKEQTAAVNNGDSSYFYKGFIPILFTRKDGQRKILARLDNTHSAVIEGATGNERQGTLPPENGYYEAGGGGGLTPPHPWKITIRTIPGSDPPAYEYGIESASRLYSAIESWGDIEVSGLGNWQPVSEGYIVLFGTIDQGVCTEASIQVQNTISDRIDLVDDAQTSFAVELGYMYQNEDTWLVRQNAFHNFTLMGVCTSAGKTALYPFAT